MRSFIVFAALALSACSASTVEDPTGAKSETLEYVGGCTPKECAGLTLPETACVGVSSVTTCAPDSKGGCFIQKTCEDKATVSSWAPCAESACGPAPAIGCAPGSTLSRQCGSKDGGKCQWVTLCVSEPAETCAPSACGDAVPAMAPLCKDGKAGGFECRRSGTACRWTPSCK